MKQNYFRFLHQFTKIFWLVILIISISSCSQPFTPPELDILSIQETYDQALHVAQRWQPDAQLHSADFYFSVDGNPEQIYCDYVFQSSQDNFILMVFMDRKESGIDVTYMESPLDTIESKGEPIPVQDLNLESHQALNIIMDQGGDLFFSRYPYISASSLNFFRLSLSRLDDVNNKGPIIWTGHFGVTKATLFMSIDDATGKLIRVKAYGEEEQEYWFRDLTVRKRIMVDVPENFFNEFDLRMDNIQKENGEYVGDLTIIAPKATYLLTGELTHNQVKQNFTYEFEDYKITIVQIGRDWVDLEVMPIVRWYIPLPNINP
jgi:hypothetical protein